VEQYKRQQNEALKVSVMLLMKRREQFMGQAAV
jgi:hypothetical protein